MRFHISIDLILEIYPQDLNLADLLLNLGPICCKVNRNLLQKWEAISYLDQLNKETTHQAENPRQASCHDILNQTFKGSHTHTELQITSVFMWTSMLFNTLRPRQNGRHFPDDIFKWISLNENVWISINISLKFVPRGPINNIPTLVQVMAWCRPSDKPLSERMMVSSLTHIYITRPQWVNQIAVYIMCMFDDSCPYEHICSSDIRINDALFLSCLLTSQWWIMYMVNICKILTLSLLNIYNNIFYFLVMFW